MVSEHFWQRLRGRVPMVLIFYYDMFYNHHVIKYMFYSIKTYLVFMNLYVTMGTDVARFY